MYWILFWIATILFSISMLLIIFGTIGFILFFVIYGEKIRLIILNLPGYTPNWFTFVDFSKPTKPWDIVGVFFFVYRIMGAIFARKTSDLNEVFKSRVPKNAILYLKCLRRMNLICCICLFAGGGFFYLQQYGFLNG